MNIMPKFLQIIISVLLLIMDHWTSNVDGLVGPELIGRARLLRDLNIGLDGGPPKPKNQRTVINMSLKIRSLNLNFDNGEFKTDGIMTLNWNDPRYSWDPERYSDITSLELPFSKAWAPEVILVNSVQEKFGFRQVNKNYSKILETLRIIKKKKNK